MGSTMDKYIGKLFDNRYEILEIIGTGGMAVVYKARCNLLNRFVAIKVLRDDLAADSEFRQRFKTEAQAVAMLSHPNIVSVYDVSRTPDLDYIVMELLEGITLKQYMKTKGALSSNESVHFASQICKALVHAHARGIVHRDIKPQNIMIALDGSVKVADFGIAHLENSKTNEDYSAVGSVHYISPEQAKGQTADARSDIYSLGIVMYEMLTGHLPYTGDSAQSVALQHVSAAPTPLKELNPEIPDVLEEITLKAMNADINERYQTAEELLADLDEYRLSSTSQIPVIAAVQTVPDEALPVEEAQAEPKGVKPIGRSGELSREAYSRRKRRANKISLLSGIFLVLIFIIAVFVFLWNYWVKDLFAEAVRLNVPNFVGSGYEDIIYNEEFKALYNFKVEYAIDPTSEVGTIISQTPVAGKSMMKVDEGINVLLTVSTGVQMVEMTDVVNTDYRVAKSELEKIGFYVELSYAPSSEITKDYVVFTSPEAGDRLPAGSTVYVTVSSGPTVNTVTMPNLIGFTKYYAETKLASLNLKLGTISYVHSDLPEGTIIEQSKPAYSVVDEYTPIYLQISKGPKEPEEEEEEEEIGEGEESGDEAIGSSPTNIVTGNGAN